MGHTAITLHSDYVSSPCEGGGALSYDIFSAKKARRRKNVVFFIIKPSSDVHASNLTAKEVETKETKETNE